MTNLPTNQMIADVTSRNAMNYLRDLDSEQYDFNPMIHLFSEEKEQPIMVLQLPPMRTDDQKEKMFLHMFALPFISLLPVEVVSVCQDTWFNKIEKSDDDEINNRNLQNAVRPSESIDRESALMTLVVNSDKTGIWHMNEYGRDDKGYLFSKKVHLNEIADWENEDGHASWIVPMILSGLSREGAELLLKEEDFGQEGALTALASGFSILNDMNFEYMIHRDFVSVVENHFSEISDTDVYKHFVENLREQIESAEEE